MLIILHRGGGLIQLAYWEFAVISLAGLVTWRTAINLFKPAASRLHKPQMETLKKIWSYSFITFVLVIAVQIVFYSDNIVVGKFLSVGMLAFYSIGGSLDALLRSGLFSNGTDVHPIGKQPGRLRPYK